MSGLTHPYLSREAKFCGANNRKRENKYDVLLTVRRTGNYTRLICGDLSGSSTRVQLGLNKKLGVIKPILYGVYCCDNIQ